MTIAAVSAFLMAFAAFPTTAHDAKPVPSPEKQVNEVIREIGGDPWVQETMRKEGQTLRLRYICKSFKTVEKIAKLYVDDIAQGNAHFRAALKGGECFYIPPVPAKIVKVYKKIYQIGIDRGIIVKVQVGKYFGYVLLEA